jgi:hypothetical protein
MISVVVGVLTLSLMLVFCVRHFFVQLVGLKLLVDTLVLLLACSRTESQTPFNSQSMAVLVSALGAALFFVLMASGIQRFAKSKNLDLEAGDD